MKRITIFIISFCVLVSSSLFAGGPGPKVKKFELREFSAEEKAKLEKVDEKEFIDAPLLKDVKLENPQETFDTIIDFISKMYNKAELVHGDISAFNVLMHGNQPYLIDLGQGVLLEHPNALEFLKRDIHNIVSYFKKFNIQADENKIYNDIIKKK